MLNMILEDLHHRHIELPSYHTLQTILTIALRRRNREIHQKLEQLLSQNHKTAMDSLLLKINDQHSQSPYVFTNLKKLIRKDNPKSIRLNLNKHGIIWEVYEQIQSLLPQLNLNESAIRYFGELVIKYKSHQVVRRTAANKYLLLLGFTAFQVRQFEDQLVDTFISACRSAFSAVEKARESLLIRLLTSDLFPFTQPLFTPPSEKALMSLTACFTMKLFAQLPIRQTRMAIPKQFLD